MARRATGIAAGAVRLAAGLAAVAGDRLPRRRHRRVALDGLVGPVDVRYDRSGVPHVYATAVADAFAVQGYLHGADRLWQLELQRRLGHGRLAELLGPSALDGDRLMRTLGLGGAARVAVEQLTPVASTAVGAYVRGLNAAIRHTPRPLELRVLGQRVSPWTPVDVLVWTATMALMLSENWTAEALRARITGVLGAPGARPDASRRLHRMRPVPPTTGPGEVTGASPASGRGSNAWAVAADRTRAGMPLLACDPHLAVTVPGIWYENHLAAPGFEVSGASVAGAPGVVIGHNATIAWGVTNARVDVQDLYLEQLDGPGDRCRTPHGWAEVTVRREEIVVRGADTHVEEVRATPHGPLVTAFVDAEPASPVDAVALKWAGPAPAGTVNAIIAMNAADDWPAFRSAVESWTSPAQSVVFADVTGRVGRILAGTTPRRNRDDGRDGQLPIPGWTGEGEWVGEVSAEDRPLCVDPLDGLVISANDRILDNQGVPLVGEWVADYRATRIRELLLAVEKHDVDSFSGIQADLTSLPGLRIRALADRLPADTATERAARDALAGWDGQLTADSVPGAVYWRFREELVRQAYADMAEALTINPGAGALRWQPGRDFLESVATPVVLDRLAAGDHDWLGTGRDWDTVLVASWRAALDGLRCDLGPDVTRWRYGRLHQVSLRHPFGTVAMLRRLVNRGPFPIGGDLDTVCAGHLAPDSSGDPQFSAATYRMICDLADWDRSRSVLPTGQSGRPGHRHYLDQTDLWLRGTHHPMPWTRAAVERLTVAGTTFVPLAGRSRRP